MKSGISTTEFWHSMIGILATTAIAVLNLIFGEVSKLPAPWGALIGGLSSIVVPPIIAWITTHYGQGRVDLKKAAIAAGNAASANPAPALSK